MAESELGMISTWGLLDGQGNPNHQKLADILTPYFNLINICPAEGEPSCFAHGEYKLLNGNKWFDGTKNVVNKPTAIMANGQMIYFNVYGMCGKDTSKTFGNLPMNSTACAEIGVDINGDKKPNTAGKDVYIFYITDYGILPRGVASLEKATDNYTKFSKHCSKIDNTNSTGWACAGWVIYNENMDYLKCGGLSWDGAHSCKEAAETNSNTSD